MNNDIKTVILINGSGGCGKSTFINFCKMAYLNTIELSTVDYVKQVASSLGWDGSKTERDRKFLYNLKVALEEWRDIPNMQVKKAIEEDEENTVFFVNVREPKNIQALYDYYVHLNHSYRVFSILVVNNNVKEIKSNKADGSVNEYKAYDYVIDNSGTIGQLLDKAYEFMNEVCYDR